MERVRDDDLGGREQTAIAHRPLAGVAKHTAAAVSVWQSDGVKCYRTQSSQ
ncbi:hypothetical protein [Nonomuraea sp. NPDC049625]|uniref:hypothetical protein n=1 Tax=Nonomuraea sp. NPDC049625 TaxID=3155775 RepID=UPI00341320CA